MSKEQIKILFSEEELKNKIENLGKKITKDYKGEELVVVGILKGAFMFMSDLVKKIDLPITIDFISVSSYGNSTESSGVVRILKDLDHSIEGKNVLLIEDIVDTGLTLNYLLESLNNKGAKSVKVCTLLDKPDRRKVNVNIDYLGFEVDDVFIVGYGIDYAQKYRNLPYIGYIK